MATHELQVTVREQGGVGVIDLVGDVDGSAGDALDRAYAEAASDGAASITLNFERAEYINSTGIALIVGLLAQARRSHVAVRACGLSEHYREIFEITRLSDFMTIVDDGARAVGDPEGADHA
jgi:anti-anti-sigma factor